MPSKSVVAREPFPGYVAEPKILLDVVAAAPPRVAESAAAAGAHDQPVSRLELDTRHLSGIVDHLAVPVDRVEAAGRARLATVNALRRSGFEPAAEQGRFAVAFDQDLRFQRAAPALTAGATAVGLDLAAQIPHGIVFLFDLDVRNQHVAGRNASSIHSVQGCSRATAGS